MNVAAVLEATADILAEKHAVRVDLRKLGDTSVSVRLLPQASVVFCLFPFSEELFPPCGTPEPLSGLENISRTDNKNTVTLEKWGR